MTNPTHPSPASPQTATELAPSDEHCAVCHALPGDWCEPWCSEQPDPALRVLDKDAQIAQLTAERDAAIREADRWRHGNTIEGDYVCPRDLECDTWRKSAANVIDLFDPLKTGERNAHPHMLELVTKAAKEAHLQVRAERDRLHAETKAVVDIAIDEANLPIRFALGMDAPSRAMREVTTHRDRLRAALVEACEIGARLGLAGPHHDARRGAARPTQGATRPHHAERRGRWRVSGWSCPFAPNWCYLTSTGDRFLVLSCDHENRIVRLFWMAPRNEHQDVSYQDLAGAVFDGRPNSPLDPPSTR